MSNKASTKKKLKWIVSRYPKCQTKSIEQTLNSKQMSATIMMPTQFDDALKEMCNAAVMQAIGALATKYGFDAEEAQRELNLGELKLVRKRGPSPKKVTEKVDKKSKADAPKAKRAPTGYLLYAADVRAETRTELEEALEEGTKLKPQSVVTAIAAKWKALEQEERDSWNTKAKEAASDEE